MSKKDVKDRKYFVLEEIKRIEDCLAHPEKYTRQFRKQEKKKLRPLYRRLERMPKIL